MSTISSIGSSMSGVYAQQRPSKAEMEAKMAEDYKNADADGSGSLNTDELTSMLSSNAPQGASESDTASMAKKLMQDGDTNGDGSLSEDELKTAMEKMHSDLESKGNATKQKISDQMSSQQDGGQDPFEKDMQALQDAIDSGDTETAKSILSQIEAHKPPQNGQSNSSSGTNSMDEQRTKDFQALSDALDSGDSDTITSALDTILKNMKQGQGQTTSSIA